MYNAAGNSTHPLRLVAANGAPLSRRLVVLVLVLGTTLAGATSLYLSAVRPVALPSVPPPPPKFAVRPIYFPDRQLIKGHILHCVAPRTVDQLLSGLSAPAKTAETVARLVEGAREDIRVLCATPGADGRTWSGIAAAGSGNNDGLNYYDVAERLIAFKRSVIPGSRETFEARQERIIRSLTESINRELASVGSESIDGYFLFALVHECSTGDWMHWADPASR